MRSLTLVSATGLVAFFMSAGSGAAAANAMPSGRYACDGGTFVDIRGSEYRGPSYEPSGPFKSYVTGAENSVIWSGGFGEFNVVSTRYMGFSHDAAAQPWFVVTYSRTHGGGVDQVDCERENS